jgi:hypothetical protein
MTWTCAPVTGVCTLDSTTVDYLTTLLQGVFSVFGALVGLAIVVVIAAVVLRKVT